MSAAILIKRSAVALKVPTTAQMTIGELAVNTYDGKVYLRGNNGADFVTQVGGAVYGLSRNVQEWQGVSGLAPITTFEFDDKALLFSQGAGQSMMCFVKVPSVYVASTQINLRIAQYSQSATNNFKFNAFTTLIRKNTDAVNSATNQLTSTNSDQPLTVAYQYLEIVYNLTDTTGKINGVAVSAGDLLKVQLSRVSTTGTDDSNDVRVLPDTAEIIFG